MMVDDSRHFQIFTESVKPPHGSCIIGVGAIGSRLAIHWAELNLGPSAIFDDDVVEVHNIANQAYILADIGQKKANALQIALGQRGMSTTAYDFKIQKQRLGYGIVACCVDTMKDRKQIFSACLLPSTTKLYVDMRMNASSVAVYLLDPSDSDQQSRYQETLYADEEVNEEYGGCQATQSVGCTAQLAASIATARMIDWLMGRQKVFETLFDWRHNTLSTQLV